MAKIKYFSHSISHVQIGHAEHWGLHLRRGEAVWLVQSVVTQQQIQAIFEMGDLNGDGELDMEEFVGGRWGPCAD